MGPMEVVNLDDTADCSLFVIDEEPITEEVSNTDMSKKRKAPLKKRNNKKSKQSDSGRPTKQRKNYVVMGGEIPDNTPRKLQKRKVLEPIVIDDDESIIELSDDEFGVIGGELSASVERTQRQIDNYHFRSKQRLEKTKEKIAEIVELTDPSPPSSRVKEGTLSTANTQAASKRKLRPIVIDGSNIAFGHGVSRRQFSSKGVEICVDYFTKRGHTVKVFVPQFRRRHVATLDTHILDKLEEDKILIYTPSRHVNGKTVVSYDDRMMVEYAAQCGAVIVTRDNLRDVASESEVFKKVIDERLLMFTWVDDVIMFPQDPLGRTGPSLDEFLSFPPEESTKEEKPSNNNEST